MLDLAACRQPAMVTQEHCRSKERRHLILEYYPPEPTRTSHKQSCKLNVSNFKNMPTPPHIT